MVSPDAALDRRRSAADYRRVAQEDYDIRHEREGGTSVVHLTGHLSLLEAGKLRSALREAIAAAPVIRVDLSNVDTLDGGAAAALAESWGDAFCDERDVQFEGAAGRVAAVLGLYTSRLARECILPQPERVSVFTQVGGATLGLLQTMRGVLDFLGGLARSIKTGLRHPGSVRWADVARLMERHGADGIGIVAVIAFLIGLISAFQAAIQLRQFGADTLVADLVSLSITRELAPLMTAIVVAGRSGAGIAAELGTMKVSEEVDALRTLGLDPTRFLVLPRILAVVLVTPLLTLLADVVGIVGGLLIALTTLEVSWQGYLLSTEAALSVGDIFGGVAKAGVFGAIIALIACERGMSARGGAEGVGQATTSAVVAILFHIVVADALLAVLFNLWESDHGRYRSTRSEHRLRGRPLAA